MGNVGGCCPESRLTLFTRSLVLNKSLCRRVVVKTGEFHVSVLRTPQIQHSCFLTPSRTLPAAFHDGLHLIYTKAPTSAIVKMRNFLENVEYTAIPLHPDIIESVPRENQQILWVGCTDGQTIETDVINVPRSEMFVHRNLGNLLSNGELSSLGAIDYCMRIIEVLLLSLRYQKTIFSDFIFHRSTI